MCINMGKEKVILQDICKSYYSENNVTQALHKINLTFSAGEFVAITGESGSGKSTLLHMIGGTDTFDEGEMFVDGETTSQYDEQEWEEYRRNKIGFVFQDYSLLGHYSSLANVMSALLVMGISKKQAEETAMDYLEQVGLKGYENQKASKLSSGQKQRLSIARALAKNTGILVADEPTGNLDSETGEQIICLLRKLSKERLVIMVTHNYEQAADYVTRKIKLHDGRVVSDVCARQKEDAGERWQEKAEGESQTEESAVEQTDSRMDTGKWKEACFQGKTAAYFARLNRRGQKGRAFLFTAFLFLISVVSFLFIGELWLQADDIFTKEYSEAAFRKKSSVRLVVKRADGKALSQKDIKKISSVRNVTAVDSCDYANDINYYIEEGSDYKYIYGPEQSGYSDKEFRLVSFLSKDKFMLSEDCITKRDLRKGCMPEARNEIVLYSADENILGSEVMCFFRAINIWGPNEYYGTKLKVTGLLKKNTSQVYFTKELCNMLSQRMDNREWRVNYDNWYDAFFPMISEELDGINMKTSFKYYNRRTGVVEGPYGETAFGFEKVDSEGRTIRGIVREANVLSYESFHEMSRKMLEVSEEFFYQLYPKERKSQQASAYICSYARTDSVIRKLEKMGYKAKSTLRVSVTDYSEELVNERMTILGISMTGLLVIFLSEILILRSLFKIRIKDFQVLHLIGMKMGIVRKISYFESFVYCLTAVAAAVAVIWVLRIAGISFLQEMMWYCDAVTYAVFILYNFLAVLLAVFFFNSLLKRRV